MKKKSCKEFLVPYNISNHQLQQWHIYPFPLYNTRSLTKKQLFQLSYNIIMSILPKGRSFTANLGTKAAVLPKGRSSTTNSGTKVAVLLGMNSCGSSHCFPHPTLCLESEQTLKDLNRSQGLSVEMSGCG